MLTTAVCFRRKRRLLLAALTIACCSLLLLLSRESRILRRSTMVTMPTVTMVTKPTVTTVKIPTVTPTSAKLANRSAIKSPSCRSLLSGNAVDIRLAESSSGRRPADFLDDGQLAGLPCDRLTAGYWTGPVSRLELDFPIAFTVTAYRSFYQVNKLMQALHRSHNAYCLLLDSKSDANFLAAAKRLAGCLANVVVVESQVVWGETSVLLADLKCFRALLYGHRKWNYVINLTGQEYPIRTLKEMVHILKLMNGSNNMEKIVPSNYKPYPMMANETGLSSLRWYKGSVHALISRAAVQYMIEDRRAQLILQHIQKNYGRGRTVPDETFFATLNHNYELLKFPGSYTGNGKEYRQIYRYKIWSGYCRAGLSVRGICILGAADLKDFNSRPEFIANKMYFDYQSDAFRCVQERFWNNTRADYDSRFSKSFVVPLSFYAELEFVQHHA